MRSIRTAEYLYVRNFEPERPPNICAEYWESDAGHNPTWLSLMRLPEGSDMMRRVIEPRPTEELYELAEDPYQLRNLAAAPDYAEVRKRLAAELVAELRRTGDPRIEGTFEEVFYVAHQRNALLRER
jgi:hypothetical protein